MKSRTFELKEPTRLTPIAGLTVVNITTTGDYLMERPAHRPYRERSVTLATSPFGRYSRSPLGLNHTVRITLPRDRASYSDFKRELEILWFTLYTNQKP